MQKGFGLFLSTAAIAVVSANANAADLLILEPTPVPAAAQPELGVHLDLSIGLLFLDLPDVDSGYLDLVHDGDALGVGLEADMAFALGHFGGGTLLGGVSLYGGALGSDSSSSRDFSGTGEFQISSASPPPGTILLDVGGAGASSVVNTQLVAGTFPTTGSQGAEAELNDAAYGGILLSADGSGTAFGALRDDDGFSFAAIGDLSDIELTTSVSESVWLTGADFKLAFATSPNGPTTYTPFAGPSFRYMERDIESRFTIGVPTTGGEEFTSIGLGRDDDLSAFYYGGLIGLDVSHTLESGVILSASGEGGVYGYDFSYGGQEKALFPTNVVSNSSEWYDLGDAYSDDASGVAWFARVKGTVTMPITPASSIGITGMLDYLSAAPGIDSDSNFSASDGTDGTFTYVPPGGTSSRMNISDMFGYGISATYKVKF